MALLLRALLAALALAALSGCAWLDLQQRQLIFRPTAEIAGTPADFGFDFEERWLDVATAPGGARPERIHAWWIAAPDATAPAILFLHGNGWNIGDSAYNTARLRRMGYSVLAIDYRGYGRSQGGFPSEASVVEDAQRGWLELKALVPDVRRRFVYGHSLGGAIAIELMARMHDAAGLIVESSFTSMRDLAAEQHGLGWLPLGALLTQRFDSLARVGQVGVPVLLIHGEADDVVPASMSRRLHEAAQAPKFIELIPGAGHSSIAVVAWERYRRVVQEFIGRFGH